jgi:hypothetical protein
MLTREKLQHHIAHLQEKHDALDKEIHTLYSLHENDLKIETLKKLKLHLKDEIEMHKTRLASL